MSFDRATVAESGLATSNVRHRTALRVYVLRTSTGQQLQVGGRPVFVGAAEECDLVVEDPKVSRRHVEIQAVSDGVRVKDLGSRNGTYADGLKLTEAVLPAGATIRVGDTTIKISGAPLPKIEPSPRDRFGGLVGESLAMREVFAVLDLASAAEATVLLQGESGTGKELAARGVHDHSARARAPFVIVDCSATHSELLDSQLFGHKRGAFTGAVSDRKGAFVEAAGGTVFLDEIGELPLASQAKLLRVLEAHTVQPLGSDRPASVDARVIAATHRDLFAMVEQKSFRADLFHRLSVVHVVIPPLRERPEDLPALIRMFYEGRGVDPGPIEGANFDALKRWPWHGNVRELRNVLERAWVLAGRGGARFDQLSIWLEGEGQTSSPFELLDPNLPFKEAKERWSSEFERRYLAAVFERSGNNITRAAEHAGLNRRHFRELLVHHRLKDS
jgi:transcriptional regulator with GAF, ATPase, and Fis domain